MIAAWLTLALAAPTEERVVALGGAVTEVVYALGAGDALVGVDTSSVYPPDARALPKVGYHRQVSAEGVLSLRPTLVLATDQAGPPEALELLASAGVDVLTLPGEPTVAAAEARIERTAQRLGAEPQGRALVASMQEELASLAPLAAPRRVAVLFGRGAGSLMVAGTDTAAEAMIRLAGGTPAITAYEGYQPLTPEALVAAELDLLVTTSSVVAAAGGEAALWAQPALAAVPAVQRGDVVVVDDLLLLGFGPRLGQGAAALHDALRSRSAP
jgi:iron complex transport system substrate-binding protein